MYFMNVFEQIMYGSFGNTRCNFNQAMQLYQRGTSWED